MKIKMKKILKYFLFIVIFIIIIKIILLFNNFNSKQVDDVIFFKISSNSKDSSIKNSNIKTVNLHETIAPGSNGQFEIVLNSEEDLKYKINLESLNKKPKNLKFIALIGNNEIVKANTLEELSKNLYGKISKNEVVTITVKWNWDYTTGSELDDLQDTLDAKNIKKYEFFIYAFGEEIL